MEAQPDAKAERKIARPYFDFISTQALAVEPQSFARGFSFDVHSVAANRRKQDLVAEIANLSEDRIKLIIEHPIGIINDNANKQLYVFDNKVFYNLRDLTDAIKNKAIMSSIQHTNARRL